MYKLVAVGDSMTMGFKSGSIFEPQFAYPSFIAGALGSLKDFTFPNFDGGKNIGGLPLSLEVILQTLSSRYPQGLNALNYLPAVLIVNCQIGRVENYWERGKGSKPLENFDPYQNLSVLTFGISDAVKVTEGECSRFLPKPKNHRLLFTQIPELPIYRAARRTLNPSFCPSGSNFTQMCLAEKMATDRGIENLIVFLGANNCLGAIIDLEIIYSESADIYRLPHERKSNLWLPEHFKKAFWILTKRIEKVGARHVYLGTVPKVTIPPISRGCGNFHNGYFDYYTRPWIWDDAFDPDKDPFISRGQAQLIDSIIDEYNDHIKMVCRTKGWTVVDICGLLDSVAFRRNRGVVDFSWPQQAIDALSNNPATSYLVQKGEVKLDTRYLRVWNDRSQHSGPIRAGGLFSLDGVHPTTFCYGIIADQFLKAMIRNGVTTVDGELPSLDWDLIVKSDSLITNPPVMLKDLRKLLGFLNSKLTGRMMLRLLEKFKGNV